MIALFQKFWGLIRQLIGLVLPIFSKAGDLRKLGGFFRWVLRFLLFAAFMVLLWFLNRSIPESWFTGPVWFKPFWLPTIGALLVAFCWLGWYIWKLLSPGAEISEFPDIDEAWAEALQALHRARTDLTEAPLFLVLGKSLQAEEELFRATGLQSTVRQAPNDPEAPIHLYAFREGKLDSIFVTCTGASLLGRQAAILTGEAESTAAGEDALAGAIDPSKTARPDGQLNELLSIIREARKQGRELTAEEEQQVYQLERKGRPALLRDAAEVTRLRARLRHLCRLIVRDRHPYCPINGLLLMIPWKATTTNEDANETGLICQQDLATAREAFQLHFPVLAMVCDMETAPGFAEFIQRFDRDKLKQRLGSKFPLAPDLPPAQVTEQIGVFTTWICRGFMPGWIYRFLDLQPTKQETLPEQIQGNGQLVRLMSALHERQKRFGEILTRGLAWDGNGPLLYGGCYVAATGSKLGEDQAFVAGVFRKVIENQEYVSWTEQALKDEASYRWWTGVGYVAIVVVTLATSALLFMFYHSNG